MTPWGLMGAFDEATASGNKAELSAILRKCLVGEHDIESHVEYFVGEKTGELVGERPKAEDHMNPRVVLGNGARILEPFLAPHGFSFSFREEGDSSGGPFAWGEFRSGQRRLALHMRWSLGLVTYSIGEVEVSHEAYMRELGVRSECRYPGFSEDPLDGFRHLASDLKSRTADFLSGDCSILRRAASKEVISESHTDVESSGDLRLRQEARTRFREREWGAVVELLGSLRHPDDLNASERRMLSIAQRRHSGKGR